MHDPLDCDPADLDPLELVELDDLELTPARPVVWIEGGTVELDWDELRELRRRVIVVESDSPYADFAASINFGRLNRIRAEVARRRRRR